ncbi:pentatricopeptide repeat-containing protein At4g18840-like [Chenopodium quinoa]|uniref:pentatricopeptide repeat-containing protein At4g18840-like n=1 Tax=Chenopodium quinoa TaxID=63459 RepID=UPI000B79169F|nr:pentatricopeptide repeat-containing protein At4g18840-like [Chenopodium quinoa]
MIRAYANSSTPQNALTIFSQMLASSTDPDKYTYPFVIKACSAFSGLNEGQQVHGLVEKCEEMRENLYVQNTLISMYAICGCFEDARKVLGKMPQRDVISWNALLSAFVEKGMMDSARLVFDEMEERNVESWNFMVSGFAKMGFIEEARRVFDEIPVKDVVSWNAVISGYADVGDFSEVLVLFQAMLREKINPDSYTLVNVLSACANLGALSQGEWVYLYIDKNGICIEGFLATALVDMYSKCGEIAKF